uniref:Uncharacterized protein n=1 Tax=viral metagenome TaxID=1070528 RepID=A0A6M3Y169_9ZZZZ
MTIYEAIEILTKLQIDDLPLPRHREWEAVQLGIEALKRYKVIRANFGKLKDDQLEGET